jgi:hypothetical protein
MAAYLNDLTLTYIVAILPVIPSLLTFRQTHKTQDARRHMRR